MATFQIETKDGKFEVQAPDNATPEQIEAAFLESQAGRQAPEQTAKPMQAVPTAAPVSANLPMPKPAQITPRRPVDIDEIFGISRGGFEGVGAGVGAFLGAPAGAAFPFLGGPVGTSIIGGGLGAKAGSFAFDALMDAYKSSGLLPDDTPIPDLAERAERAIGAGALDSAINLGFAAAGPVASGAARLGRRALGIDAARDQLIRDAAKFGKSPEEIFKGETPPTISFNVMQASKAPIIAGAGSVIGRLPFMSAPFVKRGRQSIEEVTKAKDRILDILGARVSQADLGVDFASAAKKGYEAFREQSRQLYRQADELAESTGARFPMDDVKQAAASLVDTMKGKQATAAGKPISKLGGSRQKLFDLAEKIAKLDETQTPDQIKSLLREIDEDILGEAPEAVRGKLLPDALKLIEPMQEAFLSDAAREAFPDVVAAYQNASDFYAKSIGTFNTATAKRFGRTDKRIFRPGFEDPGMLNEDQLYGVIASVKSPGEMRNLRKLLGKDGTDLFKSVARDKLETAFDAAMAAVPEKGFQEDVFYRALGYTSPTDLRSSATSVILDTAGVPIGKIRQLTQIANLTLKNIPNEAVFLKRRSALAGARGIAKAVGLGALGATAGPGLLPTIFLTLLSRYALSIANKPFLLKSARELSQQFQKPKSIDLQRQLLIRFATNLSQEPNARDAEDPNFLGTMPEGGENLEDVLFENAPEVPLGRP